jgi:hypothetical protein
MTEDQLTPAERQDALAGIDWWNSLTEDVRRYWLTAAGTTVPAEAWALYKRVRSQQAVGVSGS